MDQTTVLRRLFGLDGRVALVTGASSGIGRRMAVALASAGASVVVLARRAAALAALIEEIGSAGGRAAAHAADLEQVADFEALAREAARPFGAPDILVNAAGINLRQPPEAVTPESWDRTLRLNLTVPFFLARALVPGMRAKGRGAIINIASLQSVRAFANSAPYGASKGGIVQLTRAMAEAWSKDGITANALPTAIGRNGALTDLDGATIFFASPASAYITGQVLPVDGGYTAK